MEVDVCDNAIFMVQTIEVEGHLLNLFFDNGCGDMVIKMSAADLLAKMGRARQEFPGPITLSGVGDQKSVCEHRACVKSGCQAIFTKAEKKHRVLGKICSYPGNWSAF